MDVINKSPFRFPFNVSFAYDPMTDQTMVAVSDGKILIDGQMVSVEGIGFTGDASVYLNVNLAEKTATLGTSPSGKCHRKIITIENGREVWRESCQLCVGMTERYTGFQFSRGNGSRVLSKAKPPVAKRSTGQTRKPCYCKANNLDFKQGIEEVNALLTELAHKLARVGKRVGKILDVPEAAETSQQ